PYTFGYLFSTLVYQRVQAEGEAFRPVYEELLQRAGWERAEPLAMDVLGVDLTDPATWSQAMAGARADLEAFEALT
ncbi:MAG: M3 family oligoendopeptidase, partial [Proteobacteria bacterium]|nr:M3 family oligoendopeptidase [Pseudomonadota bacterium]